MCVCVCVCERERERNDDEICKSLVGYTNHFTRKHLILNESIGPIYEYQYTTNIKGFKVMTFIPPFEAPLFCPNGIWTSVLTESIFMSKKTQQSKQGVNADDTFMLLWPWELADTLFWHREPADILAPSPDNHMTVSVTTTPAGSFEDCHRELLEHYAN